MAISATSFSSMAAVEELPEELITIILSKLPVKSLLRFKCVSKSWYFLIKSPYLIDLHLKNSNHRCLIIRKKEHDRLDPHVLSFYSYETLIDLGIEINTPFDDNPNSFYVFGVSVSDPCNGLICITNNHDQIFICNPATREFRSLFIPPSFGSRSGYHFDSVGYHFDSVAFGLDPNSREYKVVMIGMHYDKSDHYNPENEELYTYPSSPARYRFPGDREVVVYDFSTNSWRETGIVFPQRFSYSQKSITFNGAFHWMPLGRFDDIMILSFLISDEVTVSIPLPGFYSWGHEMRYTHLCVLNNSLALIVYECNGCFEISVMTEYGEKDSWVRLLQLGPLEGICYPLAFWNPNGDDEKLLLQTEHEQLVSCDFQHQNIEYFPILGALSCSQSPCFDVFLYSESLVSVNCVEMSRAVDRY